MLAGRLLDGDGQSVGSLAGRTHDPRSFAHRIVLKKQVIIITGGSANSKSKE